MVEKIKKLGAELDALALTDRGVLGNGKIEGQLARTTNDADAAAAEIGAAVRTNRRRRAKRVWRLAFNCLSVSGRGSNYHTNTELDSFISHSKSFRDSIQSRTEYTASCSNSG